METAGCSIWSNVTADFLKAFWAMVDINTTDRDACWEWQGNIIDKRGEHGRFRYAGQRWRAHRIAASVGRPTVIGDALVLHRCNNGKCCRPSHLYVGTAMDDAKDRVRSGRHATGSQKKNSKLSEADVIEIIALRQKGHDQCALADRINVSRATVTDICIGRTWSRVTGIQRLK